LHVKCPRRFGGLEALLAFEWRRGYLRSMDRAFPVYSSRGGGEPAINVAMTAGATEHASAIENPVTVIDIALEPDQTMVGRAMAANATLLKSFPKGFALDDTHHPHVSVFMGFVPTADLPKVYDAAGKVLAKEKYTTWKLTAFKYYYIPLVDKI
jgi:hypothetical protein